MHGAMSKDNFIFLLQYQIYWERENYKVAFVLEKEIGLMLLYKQTTLNSVFLPLSKLSSAFIIHGHPRKRLNKKIGCLMQQSCVVIAV